MPVEAARTADGRPGRRWGTQGKVYACRRTPDGGWDCSEAEARALAQGRAIAASKMVDLAHEALVHRLAIKVTAPGYTRITRDIHELLAEGFAADAEEPIPGALDRLARVFDEHPTNKRNRERAAKAILRELGTELEARGVALPPERVERLGRGLFGAYALGLQEASKPLGFEIDFTLPDADAIAGLHDAGLFWIGRFYGEHFTSTTLLDEVRRVMLTEGLGRVEGGRALARVLGVHVKRSDVYWRGLAATVATRARSFGALSGMVETGAITYEYVNPEDERTSDVCQRLNGTVFTVRGSVELRERFLGATDPEVIKAIAPWPKPADLIRADATRKTPAELQAQGVAWPPLHFHCRSTIDVASWGPLPDATDPVGDVDLAPKVKRTRRAKPRTKPKAGAAPAPPSPWIAAKARLDQATAAVKAAGLEPDRIGLSQDLRDAIEQHRKASVGVAFALFPATQPDKATRRGMVGWLETLRTGPAAEPTLAARLQRELELHDELTVAYRAAVGAAPQKWLEAERVKWGRALLNKRQIPRRWSAADKALVERNWHDALSMYPPDFLRLLAIEGETFKHNGRNRRAFARASGTRPGLIEVNLDRLRREDPSPHDWQVWSHEWHHRLDGMFGGRGDTGLPWKARPGYEDLPDRWRRTFGDTFEAAKTGGIQVLRGETTSKYRWSGRFVDDYEARIYSGDRKPDAAFLAGDFGNGPIEYIAMAATYHAQHTHGWRVALRQMTAAEFGETTFSLEGTARPLGGKPSVFGRLMGTAFEPGRRAMRQLRCGWDLYGDAWRDGMEQLYGGGERFLREISDMPNVRWNGDGDVILTALAFQERYGVPLQRSVGPEGVLFKHLSREYSAEELHRLSTAVVPARGALEADQRAAWERGVDQLVGVLR